MSDVPPVLYCANHPQTETSLRCNRCEKPICVKCAVLTPTGYKCKECIRGQQKAFETALWRDYPVAIVLAGGLSFLGSFVPAYVGFFTILLAPLAGAGIAEVIRFAIQRRRSRRLYLLTTAAAAIGSLPLLLLGLASLLVGSGIGGFIPLVMRGLYSFLVTSTVYSFLSGMKLGRG
jgi:hypothetical protein